MTLMFHILAIAAIFGVAVQVKTAESLERLRRAEGTITVLRRAAMMAKAATLCWAVIYSAERDWAPWPPIVLFLACFNVWIVLDCAAMRSEIRRLERIEQISGGYVA